MVKSVKRCFKKILLVAGIALEELETVLREIEWTLNSRPLIFTYKIGYELLIPGHLIHGCRLNAISIN